MKPNNSRNSQPRFKASSLRRNWKTLAISAALLLALAGTASAQLTNNFTDGGDSALPDQYPGAAGDGWAAGWVIAPGSSTEVTATVVTNPPNGTPLSDGGNYLQWKVGGSADSTIRRQFNPAAGNGTPVFDITRPYVIEFDYRDDLIVAAGVASSNSFNNANDQVTISQNGATGSGVVGRSTFWVKAQGAANASQPGLAPLRWSFFEGALQGTTESRGLFINSTNVPFRTNTTYHFRFDVDPIARDYDATVSDGLNSFNIKQSVGRRLRWRNYTMATDANNLSNTTIMTFTARNNTATETNILSMDNLVAYQLNTNLWPVVLTQINPIKATTFFPESGYLSSSNVVVFGETNLVFTAQTFGTNSLPAANVQLVLNGVNVSGGLVFDGNDDTNFRTITYTGALPPNQNYEGTLTVSDQAGRLTSLPFFFDTFSTNAGALIIETENYNFDPGLTYCSVLQIDGTRSDRYIQNWAYGGVSALDPSGATNVVDSYFGRDATLGVDFFTPIVRVPGDFRTCSDASMRKSPGDEYERPWLEGTGTFEYVCDQFTNSAWFNYTHEWPKGDYLVYLRASCAFPASITVDLHRVTSDYKLPNQTTNKLATFILTNTPPRREILKNQLAVGTNGNTLLLHLDGKDTLRLTQVGPGADGDSIYLNRMVFVPAPPLAISNLALSGADLSFSINGVAGVKYLIQTNSDISSGTWGTLTSVVGASTPVTVHHNPIGASDQLYYRATIAP